MTFLPCISVQ